MQKGAWRPDGRSPRARSSRRRCASADEGRQRISSRYGALREPSSLSLAAFSANRLSSHRWGTLERASHQEPWPITRNAMAGARTSPSNTAASLTTPFPERARGMSENLRPIALQG